jgi:hypothetical protein
MKLSTICILTLAGVLLAWLTGCGNLRRDFQNKSATIQISGIGGKFTTYDPTSGTVAPTASVGSITNSAIVHQKGDGTAVSLIAKKAIFSDEIDDLCFSVIGAHGLHSFTAAYSGSAFAVNFDDGKTTLPTSFKK